MKKKQTMAEKYFGDSSKNWWEHEPTTLEECEEILEYKRLDYQKHNIKKGIFLIQSSHTDHKFAFCKQCCVMTNAPVLYVSRIKCGIDTSFCQSCLSLFLQELYIASDKYKEFWGMPFIPATSIKKEE